MNATDYRYTLTLTIDTIVVDGDSLDAQIKEVKERIISQLAGHRTEKRLADHVSIGPSFILSEISRS